MNTNQIDEIRSWLGTGSINIFGRQYAGKDTQCELLAKDFGGAVISGGDVLRKSVIPQHVAEAINAGHFSPTDEYRAIVTPYLSKSEFVGIPLFLSTLGRMKGEETTIIEAARKSGHEIKAVIFLDISEEMVWQRYHDSKLNNTRDVRDDDDDEALARRLKLFNESTIDVINHYRELGLLIDIDGTPDTETVYKNILTELHKLATRNSLN